MATSPRSGGGVMDLEDLGSMMEGLNKAKVMAFFVNLKKNSVNK